MQIPESEIVVTCGGAEILRKTLRPGDYIIGREAECEVPVAADLVSGRHAQLTVNFDHALIEDLGSSHGTFVNGQAVMEPTRLWPNQKIQIGAATLELHRLKTAPSVDVSLAPSTEAVRRFLPDEFLREKKYDIGGVVAQGGMGAILNAKEATTERTVAMKVMLHAPSPEDMVRFIAEAKVTAQLEHPSIVPVYELSVDENDNVFYTMKFVRGITLRKVLELLAAGTEATVRKYPLAALLTVFQKVCDAIAFAHSKWVIHRDLKPDNIMIGDFGEVLVMDWGLAKSLGGTRSGASPTSNADHGRAGARPSESAVSATLAGTVMGTPQYMAPEQARGEVERLDARADIYALGAILYHILALRPPIEGDDAWEIVQRVAEGKVDSLVAPQGGEPGKRPTAVENRRSQSVPDSLAAVVRNAMTFEREGRYPSVEALQADITAYQNGFATSAEKAGVVRQVALLIGRHKALTISLGASVLALALVGVVAFVRVKNERDHAEKTLAELRGTAPTFEADARALVAEGKLDEALAKIGYAVGLAPDNADYHLARANLFQSTQKLSEAAEEYRRVLALHPDDAAAKTNLELSGKLLAENGGAPALPVNLQGKLLDALVAQHRDLEAAPLARLLNRDAETAEATIRARLASYTTQQGWRDTNIRREGKGFSVELSGRQIGDLNSLRGLPIVKLALNTTSVADLRPLSGLPLEVLSLNGTHVSDLSPLRGMKLESLSIENTEVGDLSPLSGMPLKYLYLSKNQTLRDMSPLAGLPLEKLTLGHLHITDINVLRGMPLKELLLRSTYGDDAVPDFSPLANSQTLEKISLPKDIVDIAFLATLPKLQQVEYNTSYTTEIWMPARDFFARYGPDVPEIKAARAALAAAGVKDLPIWRVALDPDHQLRLDLGSTPLSDLRPLRGLAIRQLDLNRTEVRDLEPLRGMPINDLSLYFTKVRDLAPLRGMPIKKLNLGMTGVTDFEPLRGMPLVSLQLRGGAVRDVGILAEFPDLEEIELPVENPANVERLRQLPKLRYLSFGWNGDTNHPAQTVVQFWKEYDAKAAGAAQK